MPHKLFGIRSAGSLASKPCRRLELEFLEDRVPPALMVAGAPAGPYVAGGSFGAVPGTSIFVPQDSASFEGDASDYPTYFRGFDYSSDAYTVTVLGTGDPFSTTPGQNGTTAGTSSAASAGSPTQLLGQMEQLVGILSAMTVAQTHNPSQALNLAVDEFFAAVDTFALSHAQASGINTSAIQNDLTARQTAIQNNPVDHTPIGHQLGTAAFNTALYMLTINRGIGT